MDGGLPLPAVERDVEAAARYLEFYGGLADKIGGDVVPIGREYLDYTEREPWGVCAVVLPYNSPFQILARSLAPAARGGQHRGREGRRAGAARSAAPGARSWSRRACRPAS